MNIPQTVTTDELEAQARARLLALPTALQVAEMTIINSNYHFLRQDEPELTDNEAKRRVLEAWLEKQRM